MKGKLRVRVNIMRNRLRETTLRKFFIYSAGFEHGNSKWIEFKQERVKETVDTKLETAQLV